MKKGSKISKWTKEEDARLVAIISENSNNFSKAFKLFAEEYPHRSIGATQIRWYSKLRKDNNTKVCMSSFRKTTSNLSEKIANFSIWNKILDCLFGK